MGQTNLLQKLEVQILYACDELPKIKSSRDPMLYIKFMNLNILYAKMKQFIFLPIKKSAYIT
jgi:hypothetical protein